MYSQSEDLEVRRPQKQMFVVAATSEFERLTADKSFFGQLPVSSLFDQNLGREN